MQAAVDDGALRDVTWCARTPQTDRAPSGAVPADLVLMAGVFGNITDADAQQTITALPEQCAADATVI